MVEKKIFFWDLETLNVFTATFIDRDSDYKRVFILTKETNQINELINFLNNEVIGLIGYNSIYFDAQIIEYIYRYPDCTANDIRSYAMLITSEDRKPDVPEWKLRHNHLDLFKALSLSTKAKRTSLKWCEFMIDFDNIEDLPSQGEGDNWLEKVLSYNLNDVLATKELYFKYEHEINLRRYLTEKEGINLFNCTEPDLSKKLFSKYLSKYMGISEYDLRSMQTDREVVSVKDIIFPYIKFQTEKFNLVKKCFENLNVKEGDKEEFVINHNGIDITYALGGIHAAPKSTVVESSDTHIIKSVDVISFYPNLAIKNNICAEHLPKDIFLKLYNGFFEERKLIPKKDPRNYILKILLNSTYGLSNDKYSFLKDRKVTLSICINGQLLLTMLMERLTLNIPDAQLIMMNTDGFEIKIPREFENEYYNICKEWELLTNLELEFVDYQKMIISDVNNYISIYSNGKTKCKGKYEFENIPLHKNKSHSIIPIAVYNYWVNNIPIEETILNHKNIFDFCAGVRAKKSDKKGQSRFELHYLKDGKLIKEKLSKTVRYFISKTGKVLIKKYENGSEEFVEAPLDKGSFRKFWEIQYFNKFYLTDNYNIDYTYYIYHAKKWINEIKNSNENQLF